MTEAYLIYPHQLFESLIHQRKISTIILVEEPLFFTQFRFHKKKLIFHRATMKAFAQRLMDLGFSVVYVESSMIETTADVAQILQREGIDRAVVFDVVDDWLQTRLEEACRKFSIRLDVVPSPGFYLTRHDVVDQFSSGSRFMMATFYIQQRKRFRILIDEEGPRGGKWSFDTENRKRIPKNLQLPAPPRENEDPLLREATSYVEENFTDNYGSGDSFFYPITHSQADKWLNRFLHEQLHFFGPYQDAIVQNNSSLFHSQLSPLLNAGLLTPQQVVDSSLAFAAKNSVSLNSLEGFIRQILGWREFVRGVYCTIGRKERTTNFWGHRRKLPHTFWTAKTGILPIDGSIKKLLQTAYLNHIERLMLISNFMLLCEIDPDDAYRWFMELFIDAYDWVMVPNVYGMGLYADGGMITTKPYISGSHYVLKMSDYPKGEWADIWNSLYWNFVAKHVDFFRTNPRMRPMAHLIQNMDPEILQGHKRTANRFLQSLSD